MRRHDVRDALLFLPAMLLLAGAVFLGMYAVSIAGGWILRGWFAVLSPALPRPVALALSVLLAAASVYALTRALPHRKRGLRV